MTIWRLITEALMMFHVFSAFHRVAAFSWFAVTVMATMVRTDRYGIASVIRAASISGKHYTALDHFFHAYSWSLHEIRYKWHQVVRRFAHPYLVNNKAVLAIDHTKKPKEGRRMPGVQKMTQESETQSKPEYIHGHMYGGVCMIASRSSNDASDVVAIPLILQLQSGITHILKWIRNDVLKMDEDEGKYAENINRAINDLDLEDESALIQLIDMACKSAEQFGRDFYILADRAFLTEKAIEKIDAFNSAHGRNLSLVTRCKRNITAYKDPGPREPGKRGAPRKLGDSVKLFSLFSKSDDEIRRILKTDDQSVCWQHETLELYGKPEDVSFLVIDLLWRSKLQKLRFVLVSYGDVKSVLVTTDRTIAGKDVIHLYGMREKIECTFRESNQVVAAFSARFWTSAMPKLNHFRKKSEPNPLETIKDLKKREQVVLTIRASELYAAIACIAIGLIHIISLSFDWEKNDMRWQRTPTNFDRPSEACLQEYLRARIDVKILRDPTNPIATLLQDKLTVSFEDEVDKTTDAIA